MPIIDCISDLHGFFPKLEGGDLLIVAGDLTARDDPKEHFKFCKWLHQQNYRRYIIVAGNHDNSIQQKDSLVPYLADTNYLEDSGAEFEGLKIWGSPWTRKFKGQNPKAMAFSLDTEEELSQKWAMIPEDTDILITHSPAYGIKDQVNRKKPKTGYDCVGSKSLQMELYVRLSPKLHVFGHIHESYGIDHPSGDGRIRLNASYVNEHYQPVNKPIRIEL